MSYPGFHKYVNRLYLITICVLAAGLPILHLTIQKPSLKNIIIIIVCVMISYVAYWLIVRLNCYGTPNTIYQSPRLNSSTSSSTNGGSGSGGSSNAYNHPTFASYRLGGLTEIFRRYGDNNGTSNSNDDEINSEMEAALRPPPPTYSTALQGAGLPPPYVSSNLVEVNVHNSEIPQMTETPRRPVPPIPQQQSSIQSPQYERYTSQDSIISDSSTRRSVPPVPSSSLDSTPQPPKRPVPPIPSSSLNNIPKSPKRPVPPIPSSSSFDSTSRPTRRQTPPVPTSSSSTLPPRLYKSISYDK